jgi:hypothetical protein
MYYDIVSQVLGELAGMRAKWVRSSMFLARR